MTIEIYQPRLEALIQQRMASGRFESVEEALIQALEAAPFPAMLPEVSARRTGAELVAAMQAMPHSDVDIEASRPASRKSLAQLFAESPFRGTDMEFERDLTPLRPVEF